jgi:acyl dehydratase
MSTASTTIENARRRIGEELGLSDWVTINQAKLDAHARNTGDEDWLHNDPARAARESPFGKTIAQGSLLLSMLVGFVNQIAPLADDIAYGLNYGFDRVRFIRPVPVDSRVRARMVLKDVRPKGDSRYLVTIEATIEQEGTDEPRLAAEWLALVVQA